MAFQPVERNGRSKPGSLRVVGSVDLRNIQLTPSGDLRKGALDLYIVQQDQAGKILDKSHDRLNLRLTPDRYAAYLVSGVYSWKT